MSSSLNLFPARIRWCNADGTLTPEASRALYTLTERVGGTIGDVGVDTFAVLGSGSDQQGTVLDMTAAPVLAGDLPLPEPSQPTAPSFAAGFVMQGNSDGAAFADVVVQPASAAGPFQAVAATASPMAYTARDAGHLSVQGGTVSALALARGSTSITLGQVSGLIPLAAGDKVTITYTAAPTLTFIPR